MTPARHLGLAVTLLLIGAHTTHAQTLRGTIVDSASRQPITGAVISALDSAGRGVGRIISNANGTYRLTTTVAARRVRVLHIGFRPIELAIPADQQLDVAMVRIPTLIDPVLSTAKARCPDRPDRAAAFALLEQARAGLLAIVVARESNPAALVRLGYTRVLNDADQVTHQTVRADAPERTATSFNAARPATAFAREGFRSTRSQSEETFYGPDVETLLDDSFAEAYCFHLARPDSSRRDQIGLSFVPERRRADRIDIEGTLWIDSVARVLRDIEFRYIGLGRRIESMRPGGRVAFQEMRPGVVLIDRWHLRLVGGAEGGASFEVRETGGEVARAAWPDSEAWRGTLGKARLRLVKNDGTTPAPGVLVRLFDTHYEAESDSNGIAEIEDLLPGPYVVILSEPRYAKYGVRLETPIKFVAGRDSVFDATLRVPSVADFVAGQCAMNTRRPGTVRILGRVETSDGKPVNGARWTVSHFDGPDRRKPVADGLSYRRGEGEGLFELCSPILAQDDILEIIARTKTASGSVRVQISYPVTLVTVRLDGKP